MIKKIAATVGVRFLNAIMGLLVVIVATQNLGAGGYGTVTLVILAVTLIQLVTNFVGGSALVYLIPRGNALAFYVISVVWAVITSVAGTMLLDAFLLIPAGYAYLTLFLSLLLSLGTINMMVLLAGERMGIYNLISLLQPGLVLATLVIYKMTGELNSPEQYITALFVAYGSVLLISLISIRNRMKGKIGVLQCFTAIKNIARYGGLIQLATLIQFLNYRLGYYLIEFFYDKAMLGKLAVGVQLAEGIWLIAKSVALVQYSRISNEKDNPAYAVSVTIAFMKLTMLATLAILIVLIVIPGFAYVWLFGKEFTQVKEVLYTLSPGILFMAASQIFSHYFSGTGRPQHNTISSAIGLGCIVIAGLLLIPHFGLAGAGLAGSISYFAIVAYQYVVFRKTTQTGWQQLFAGKADWGMLLKTLKSM